MDLQTLASRALEGHLQYAERVRHAKSSAGRFESLGKEDEWGGSAIVRAFDQTAMYGETFAWRTEMLGLALRASESLNPAWAFHRSCLIAPSGYAQFESTISFAGAEYVGLAWATAVENEGDPELHPGEWTDERPLTLLLFLMDADGDLVHFYGAKEEEATEIAIHGDHEAARFLFLVSALELSSQKIATIDDTRPSRPSRRRAASWRAEPLVRIIQLRRLDTDGRNREIAPIDWRCRWIVGGHWRDQWFPKTQAHRPVWISPYIKGPDEKPLKLANASVFVVSR